MPRSTKASRTQGRPLGSNGGPYFAHVIGWGVEVPEFKLTNRDIEQFVNTSDQWIRERTGIQERHIAGEGEDTVTMAVRASRRALTVAGIQPHQLDLIVCATSTPQYFFPSTACLIQDRLGATSAGAFDVLAACTGFIYALSIAAGQLRSGSARYALVLGTETLSRVVDWEDRNTCILFGDGAGAFVLAASQTPGGIGDSILRSDGSGAKLLYLESGMRTGWSSPEKPTTHTRMDGREVFRFATRAMATVTTDLLERNHLTPEDLALIVPHQANVRIIETAARNLGLPIDRFFVNLHKYGNTSTASIPLALVEALEAGRIKPKDKLLLVGFGAGLTWGSLLLEWSGAPDSAHAVNPVLREGWYVWALIRSWVRRFWRRVSASLWRNYPNKRR